MPQSSSPRLTAELSRQPSPSSTSTLSSPCGSTPRRGFLTPLAAAALLVSGAGGTVLIAQGTPAAVPGKGAAQTQTNAGPVVLQGTVADPDAAVIPGATVTLTPSGAQGAGFTASSGSDGSYSFRGVPAGTYTLTATMPGFATYVRQGVKVTGDVAVAANIKMTVGDQSQTITVTADENTVSVDPEKNAGGTVLTEKDLDAFSDDPDELSDELSALAGPAAGPNGGQIYIDGFTGGQLPPKSSIREIRINQNPFSAEYDQPGFGRIEIFTKPGTDKLHGDFRLNGYDKSFNTGSPFIPASQPQPGYHTILSFDTLSGPINKHASFSVSGSYRGIQNNTIVDPPAIYAASQGAGEPCPPGTTTGCQIYSTLPSTTTTGVTYPGGDGFTLAQFQPQTRYDFGPRFDLALGEKNTATIRATYEHNAQQNQGVGGGNGLNLYSTGYNSVSSEVTVQVSDTQIVSSKVINETRFEFQREASTVTPFNTTPSVTVQGSFTSGGYSGQTSSDFEPHFEVQNYTSVALAKHFMRFGGRLRSTADQNTTTAGSNGSFSYTSLGNYINNTLSDYTITNILKPTVNITSVDLGVYAEDDWKIKPNLTFSYGLRYETQNFLNDHKDFAPRLALAYGITKKTVLRAGFGLFYNRFLPQYQTLVTRNDGTNQQQRTISSKVTAIPTTCSPSNLTVCNSLASTSALTVDTIAPRLRAPYQVQENLGVDQQLFKNATLSVNYQHVLGVRQFDSNVVNVAAVPNSATSIVPGSLNYQFQSEATFNQNQLIANVNIRGYHGVSLFGFYALTFAQGDDNGIGTFTSVPNDVRADYGRTSFDVRSRLFMGGSFNLPHLVTLSPFMVAQSGQPYAVTSGLDEYGTNIFNYRAALVPAGGTVALNQNGATGQLEKTIAGCGTFVTPGTMVNGTADYTEAPNYSCTGPANFTLNLRVVKTIGFGPQTGPRPDRGSGGGPGGGPPGGGRGGRGGGGGGFGGGGASSGKRYNLSIGGQVQNLFNVADRGVPQGNLTSPSFGTSTSLANAFFTNNDAVRRISLQIGFSF